MMFDSIRIRALALTALLLAAGCTQSHDPGERLYVSNERGDSVVAIDPNAGRVVERLRLGQRPRGLQLSPDGTHLYVAVSGTPVPDPNPDQVTSPPSDPAADGIVVLDLKSGKVERVLQVGRDPSTFTLSPDGRTGCSCRMTARPYW
jgi:YVTN family beta-propeller protein